MRDSSDSVSNENRRRRVAIYVIVLLSVVVITLILIVISIIIETTYSGIVSFEHKTNLEATQSILGVLIVPVVGLLGAAVGYYFAYRKKSR